MQYVTFICLFLSAVAFQSSFARPNGAPETACQTLRPGHPDPPQSTPAPYVLVPSALTVNRGQQIQVTIRTQATTIGGFIIQAREVRTPTRIIGQFVSTADDRVRLMQCAGVLGSSATHTSPAPKNNLPITWRAPTDFTGRVFFT